ncbi:nucleoside 2-deoxyribosyltransferase [Salmonella enterica subsp. enterica serovar Newport]|nr:nucleoside 2-deoxyribosyltransferase [Salmonella enterica subsp. enterica serovar Newport]
MSVVYISGPMSGLEDFNRTAFAIAARNLDAKGYTVLNPAILPDSLTYGRYIKISKAMLECADTIYLLEGWRDSAGATAEHALAKKLDLKISTPESRKGGAS